MSYWGRFCLGHFYAFTSCALQLLMSKDLSLNIKATLIQMPSLFGCLCRALQ